MDSRSFIHTLLVYAFAEIFVHSLESEWVAVGDRVAQYGVVFSYAHEVHSPGVDTDARYRQLSLSHEFQSLDDFVV